MASKPESEEGNSAAGVGASEEEGEPTEDELMLHFLRPHLRGFAPRVAGAVVEAEGGERLTATSYTWCRSRKRDDTDDTATNLKTSLSGSRSRSNLLRISRRGFRSLWSASELTATAAGRRGVGACLISGLGLGLGSCEAGEEKAKMLERRCAQAEAGPPLDAQTTTGSSCTSPKRRLAAPPTRHVRKARRDGCRTGQRLRGEIRDLMVGNFSHRWKERCRENPDSSPEVLRLLYNCSSYQGRIVYGYFVNHYD